ncbi:hypothetical protein EDB85DRAFT_1896525 [Lactarius pseudohatsudake]|nr:hypothetical protein EDB85DRAFT_1896525 [Lactarius pseudohatsudake]
MTSSQLRLSSLWMLQEGLMAVRGRMAKVSLNCAKVMVSWLMDLLESAAVSLHPLMGILCWARFDPVANALALDKGANFGSFLFCFFALQFFPVWCDHKADPLAQGRRLPKQPQGWWHIHSATAPPLGVFFLLRQPVLLFLFGSVLLKLLIPGSSLVVILSGSGFSQALSGTLFGEGVYAWVGVNHCLP